MKNFNARRGTSRLHAVVAEPPPDGAGMMRWLLTYADMITLLLALFVILFSVSTVDRVKVQRLAHDISGGFAADDAINNPPNGGTTGVLPATVAGDGGKAAAVDTDLPRINARLKAYVAGAGLQSEVSTRIDRRGLVITLLADGALYASGSADLPAKTKRLLDEIDTLFVATNKQLRVEGNTDSVPIQTAVYPTNWELSAARATGVTRYLVERRGLSPLRVSLAGYGEYRPRSANDSAADRRYNRRVDIVILNDRMSKADAAVQP